MPSKMEQFICVLVERAIQKGASASQIIRRAEACGILPPLMHAVYTHAITAAMLCMSESDLQDELNRFRLRQTAKMMLWHKTASAVLGALSVDAIVLKGAPLGELFAGDALWRDTTDFDVWIAPEHCEQAVRSLECLGYRIAEMPRVWATNQVMLEHDVFAPVEIHWALAPQPWKMPEFGEAFERSRMISFRGTEMRILGDSDLRVHLLVHAHQHYFAVKTIVDLLMTEDEMWRVDSIFKPYGLDNLHNLAVQMSHCFGGGVSDTFVESCAVWCAQKWYGSVLADDGRGELVFGREDKSEAAIGVLLRALSMGLLDGMRYPVSASLQVILAGPHRIGALMHKFFYQFQRKYGS